MSTEPEETLAFEEALERLESLVHRLEEGEISLEESVQTYAEGMRLVRFCLTKLDAAEATIRELAETEDGFVLTEGTPGDDDEPV